MNFVFLIDPFSTIKMEKDTSFTLMWRASQLGHKIFCVFEKGIVLKENKVFFQVIPVVPQKIKDNPFNTSDPLELSEDEVDIVFIRTDPPFDESYLLSTWLLERLPSRIPIINNPAGIRTVNEKIWATQFKSIIPKTLVSCQKKEIAAFFAHEQEIIIKPTDSFGGNSIFYVQKNDKNANVIFETVTQNWTKYVIAQKYIREAQQGDKRILLLNGEPLGAVLRQHKDDDHRNNFFSGGTAVATEITDRDQRIIETIKPSLQELGVYFVGIDIIGDYLIEINVTSPTCLQEMNRFDNKQLEDQVIDFALQLINKAKT